MVFLMKSPFSYGFPDEITMFPPFSYGFPVDFPTDPPFEDADLGLNYVNASNGLARAQGVRPGALLSNVGAMRNAPAGAIT